MFKTLKNTFIDMLMDFIFILLIIAIPVIYYIIIPNHWGKLTIVTIPALCWYWGKLHVKLIK
ncbi:hypothetical protein COO59_11190 [Mixta theicola]|uniref:Uncharacterized protein n=1 Tax=Mixta theicola TaxID=1458355 RepID=A0A2K1Q9C2_9GAMM|nr:hypothetical protein COO59_11190 [Mixta theicola]GLR08669.1 hypothetical protein GCM10007905_13880 [Mixta theicola]